jgi:hypothetical protein
MDVAQGRPTVARLRPELSAQHPSIPSGTWYAVVPYNPTALCPEAEPGFVWVEIERRPRKLPAEYFELRATLSRGDCSNPGRANNTQCSAARRS